jgi:hypothetical protein
VEAETAGILPSVRALQIPSPGWERARVRGIKKADSDNFVSEQERSDEAISLSERSMDRDCFAELAMTTLQCGGVVAKSEE